MTTFDSFTKRLSLLIVLPGLLLLSHKTLAVDPLSTKELADHCALYNQAPEGIDAIFCVYYIQGFIDGAVATDETVMNNVFAELEKDESFTARAMRTRSPSRAGSTRDASYYAEYCLGEQVPLKEVVEQVIQYLMNQTLVEETQLARDAVYTVLRRDYACVPETK